MENVKQMLLWVGIAVMIGVLSGISAAVFLLLLDWVTDIREANNYLVLFLPFAGLVIGALYFFYGKEVGAGNNLIIEEIDKPSKAISWKMAPFVLLGTLITHLYGGSAGREGTAVQMSASIADQFQRWFKLADFDRKLLLRLGVSGGFAAVFGTPLAAAVFAIELIFKERLPILHISFIFLSAFVADYTVSSLGVHHTHYAISLFPDWEIATVFWIVVVGLFAGLAALFFIKFHHFFSTFANRFIAYPPFRPFIGGAILALLFTLFPLQQFQGLGVPIIQSAFSESLPYTTFFIKILLTAFTIGVGFKGGEVTPLFFIGATLGNALMWFVPLPLSLLAGVGFVAVFCGATNTLIASTIMGAELFGIQSVGYIFIANVVAYFFSGTQSIYSSQPLPFLKSLVYQKLRIKH